MCPQERLVIVSYTTGLSFVLERIGPLVAITIIVFYLLALYLFALPSTPENPFASIYSESLIKTACQHLLLLVGFDTLILSKVLRYTPYTCGSSAFSRGGSREIWNVETEAVLAKIGGGNDDGVGPVHFYNLSNITTIATIMKRE
jgi:hypothetical protein